MAENVDLSEVVPPSPVSTSTQITSQQRNRLPLFPRLPSLDVDLDISAIDVEPLSPIARVYAGQAPQDNHGNRTRSTSGLDLNDWLIRETRESSNRDVQPRHAVVDVIELDNENSRPSSVNSEVISIADGSSDIEHVSDSGDDAVDGDQNDNTVVNRPANPEPPEELVRVADQAVQGSHEDHAYPSNPAVQTPDAPPTAGQVTEPAAVTPATPGSSTAAPLPIVQVLGGQGQSPADFRSPKRKRVHSPESSVSGEKKIEEEEEDEGDTCPICFDTWTTSGLHRLCSLRCGHLFGQSCIEKWLKGQGGKCPQCNAKAKRQDIRVLYAKSIKALDTSERDRALKDLEKERDAKRRAEMEGAQMRLQYHMTVEENNRLKLEVEMLKSQLRKSGGTIVPGSNVGKKVDVDLGLRKSQIAGQFVLDRTIRIWDAGNCRVMAHCPSLATVVASQPSSSPLFPGFGVKKICTLDFKTCQYITIHSKAIRDVAFHPTVEDGMLLSCGLDKKVKMTSLLSNAVVQTYETAMPAWSCVWNSQDRNYFYAGLQNGLVLEFDIRNTEGPVQEFNREGSRSPVASLCYMSEDMNAEFRSGGLLIGQLDKVSFFEKLPSNQHRLHLLPLEGNLTSLHIEPNTRHVLASYRPTGRHPTIRHQLCELISRNISANPTVIDNVCSCNVIHTFHGGRTQTVLSKTIVQQHPGDNSRLLVCAGDETNNSIHLWDSGTGQLSQRLITGGVAVDMCSLNINNTAYLAALTDKLLKIYKWT